MRLHLTILFTLLCFAGVAQQDTTIHNKRGKQQNYLQHSTIATLSVGFIDYYRNNYSLPAGFVKNNTSGFAPLYGKLEYGVGKDISLAAAFSYDNFQYNYNQLYEGNGTTFTRYKTNNFRLLSGGLTAYYHLGRVIKVKHLDPFVGIGINLNNIRYSALPQGDSAVVKIDHPVSPYIKAGARYYISNKLSLFGDIGYDKLSVFSLGLSCRLSKRHTPYSPDSDGDGVPDRVDSCPHQPGLADLHGCPDSDGDGIPDREDSCPHEAGLIQFHGCPDSDGDGVPDREDSCPHQAGMVTLHGCPDSDSDGIPDREDACPLQVGLAVFKGCPDTDGDGIPDNIDKCPLVAGPADNNGCPRDTVVKPAVPQAVEIKLTENVIQFGTGKANISKKSYTLLGNAIKDLKENDNTDLSIDGYTDNTGKAAVNRRLSKQRAEAVKKYFIHHGIAGNRLITKGHGSKTPVATNHTRAGRAKNRRVVLGIKYNSGN